MGSSNSKKPAITIKSIRSSTEDIRSSLRRKQIPVQNKEELHQTLINNSKQLDTLRSKKSKKTQLEIDQIQKLVRDVNEELLEYNDDHLDKGTDESHSFIHVNPNQLKQEKKNSTKVTRQKTNTKTRITLSRLNEIEQKLTRVKNDVTVGIRNDDNQILQLQKKKIEMLQTDLELLNVSQTSQDYEKKQNLEKDLYRYYQKIIRREKNQARLSRVNNDGNVDEVKRNCSKLKAIEIMIQDIQDVLQNIDKGDNRGNVETCREELDKIQSQLNEIKDDNRDNLKMKTILLKKVNGTKKFLDEVEKKREMNDLDEIMEEIDKIKSDKNKMDDILELKSKIESYQVKHEENEAFKNRYLEELNMYLGKMDPNHDGVIMRQKKLKSTKSIENLIHLQQEWQSLEKNISMIKPDEVKKVDTLLENFEESIKAKRRSLADLLKKKAQSENERRRSSEVIRTSAKIFDLPKIQTTKSNENMKKEQVTPIKYGTIEHVLEEITKISDRVEEIGKNILAFKGTSEDLEYNFFKASLLDKQEILQNLSHRSSWNQVDTFKFEILEKIGFFEEYLKYKLNQNILEMKLNEKLKDLDAKIKRFTGSYNNIQFRSIDCELSNCLKEVEYIDMDEKSEKLKQRTNYLKNMLKEKSQFDVPFHPVENLTDTKKIITENKEYIQKLKKKVENTAVLDTRESVIIEECLLSKTMELINLNLKNDTPMFQDVKKLLEDIETCKNLLKNKRKKQELNETFDDIEEKLLHMEKDISHFDGLVTDKIFFDLNENLKDLEVKLSRIEGTEDTQGKNLELSLKINILKSRLHEVALDSEKILEVENRIKELLEMFSQGVPDIDFDELDEEFIKLRIQLNELGITEKLSYRKLTCVSYIEYLMKKMNETNKQRNGHVSRSIIV